MHAKHRRRAPRHRRGQLALPVQVAVMAAAAFILSAAAGMYADRPARAVWHPAPTRAATAAERQDHLRCELFELLTPGQPCPEAVEL